MVEQVITNTVSVVLGTVAVFEVYESSYFELCSSACDGDRRLAWEDGDRGTYYEYLLPKNWLIL